MTTKSPYNSVQKSLQSRLKIPTNQFECLYNHFQDSVQYRSRVPVMKFKSFSNFVNYKFCNVGLEKHYSKGYLGLVSYNNFNFRK